MSLPTASPPTIPINLHEHRVRPAAASHRSQAIVVVVLSCFAAITLATTAGIIAMLLFESAGFFFSPETKISMSQFLTGTEWNVGRVTDHSMYRYGIWPLMSGTLRITVIAMLIALPLGLITAIYLSEYAPRRLRAILKPALEVLAGIPTVVLGFFAVMYITPWLQSIGHFQPFNSASAGIAVGILCLPLACSLSEDALRAVPQSLRDASYGLGGTRFDTTIKVVVPAAVSGIVSAFLLAIARAVGETMIVALAAGSTPIFTFDPRSQSQTMTGFIVERFQSENVVPGTVDYYSIYAVATTLFVMTFGITLIGQWIRRRYREAY